MTRNAAQAFAARVRQLPVARHHDRRLRQGSSICRSRIRAVSANETVSRSGDIQFFIGHVNLTLGEGPERSRLCVAAATT